MVVEVREGSAGDTGGDSDSGDSEGGGSSCTFEVIEIISPRDFESSGSVLIINCPSLALKPSSTTQKTTDDCPDCTTETDGGVGILSETKPCPGDPVKNPKVAPQKNSGAKGALQGYTRYGSGCTSSDGRTKPHAGIDLKSEYGNPIYAMYSGFIFSTKHDPLGAGYYTRIQSTVNGETFLVEYYHLQKENRILQGNPLVYVNAGDIIGYQGDSGNLKKAIIDKTVDSHIHIEVRVHDGSSQWGYDNFNLVDPRDYLNTTIDDNGITQSNTNCN